MENNVSGLARSSCRFGIRVPVPRVLACIPRHLSPAASLQSSFRSWDGLPPWPRCRCLLGTDGLDRRSAKAEVRSSEPRGASPGLPSVALAKGGGKAERVGLLHSGSFSWLALLRFSGGLPPGRRWFPIRCRWIPPRHPLRRRLGALILSLRLIGPAVDHQSRPAFGDFRSSSV